MAPPGAVVIGGYVNGLGIVRSLAALGVPTAVVTTKPFDIAHRSRWCAEHASIQDVEQNPEPLVELLEHRARRWHGRALFPTNDEALAALAGAHERLSSSYRLVAPPPEVARYFLDKSLLAELAESVGAPAPRRYGPAMPATADLADLSFPVAVKPLFTPPFAARFGRKLLKADTRAELRDQIAQLIEARIEGQVYDWVPGEDDRIYAHCTYIGSNGEPAGALTVRKLRQGPPFFGDARVAEVARPGPDLAEITVELLRRVGFRGMAIAEFKLDARDDTPRFIEVNARSVVYNGLLRRAGLDLARLAWSDLAGERAEPGRDNGWPGVWVNLHSDLLHSLLDSHGRPAAAEFAAPYARPVIEATWSARDPLPFAAQWSRTAREAVGGASRRLGARTATRPRETSRPPAARSGG